MDGTSDLLIEAEIKSRMGVLPSFFGTSDQKSELWARACSAYLDNPLPSMFKERLFTYLSRFSKSSYCLCRHSAFLLGYGTVAGDPTCAPISAGELLSLLKADLPERDYGKNTRSLFLAAAPIEQWPSSAHQSELEEAIFWHCVLCFVSRDRIEAQNSHALLKRYLPHHLYTELFEFLGFVKIAHFRSEMESLIELEDDVMEMFTEVPELENWLDENPAGFWNGNSEEDAPSELPGSLAEAQQALVAKIAVHKSEVECLNNRIATELSSRNHVEQALETANSQLKKAQKAQTIGHVAASIVREVNSDLNAISDGVLRLLQDGRIGRDNADAQTIFNACDQSADLASKLLQFDQNPVSEPQVVDLGELVSDANSVLTAIAGSANQLKVKCKPGAFVRGDPGAILQVLFNLLLNAHDAVDQGGKIEISVTVVDTGEENNRPKMVCLRVTDNGHGMSEETLQRAFEPFFTTKSASTSTGLGLQVTQEIVTKLGGQIGASSNPDEGTEFEVYLPLAKRSSMMGSIFR